MRWYEFKKLTIGKSNISSMQIKASRHGRDRCFESCKKENKDEEDDWNGDDDLELKFF